MSTSQLPSHGTCQYLGDLSTASAGQPMSTSSTLQGHVTQQTRCLMDVIPGSVGLQCDASPILQRHVAHQAGHDFPGVHAHLQPHAAAIWQREAVAEVQQRQRQAHKRGCMLLIAVLGARHKNEGVAYVEDTQALRCCYLATEKQPYGSFEGCGQAHKQAGMLLVTNLL